MTATTTGLLAGTAVVLHVGWLVAARRRAERYVSSLVREFGADVGTDGARTAQGVARRRPVSRWLPNGVGARAFDDRPESGEGA